MTGTGASAVSGAVRNQMPEQPEIDVESDEFLNSVDFASADPTSDDFLNRVDFQSLSEQKTADETLGQWFANAPGRAVDFATKTGSILKGYGETVVDLAKEAPAAAESLRQSAIDALSTPREWSQIAIDAPSLTAEQQAGPQMQAQDVGFLTEAADFLKESYSAFKENPNGIYRGAIKALTENTRIPVYDQNGQWTGATREETDEERLRRKELEQRALEDKYNGAALFTSDILNFATDPFTWFSGVGALKSLALLDKTAKAKQALALERATVGGGPVTAAAQKAAQLEAKAPALQRAAIIGAGIAAYEAPSIALDMHNRVGEIDAHEVAARTIATTGGGLILDKAITLASALGRIHDDKNVPAQLDKLTEVMGENVQKGLNTEESLLRGMKAVGLDPDLPDDALALRTAAKLSDEFGKSRPVVTEIQNRAGPKSQFEQARQDSKAFKSGLTEPSATEKAFEQTRQDSKAFKSGLTEPSATEKAFEQARQDSKKFNLSALKGQRGSAKVIPDYMANGKYGIEVRKDGARVYLSEADTLEDAMTRAQKMANDTGAKVRVLDPQKKDGVTLVVPEHIGTKVDPFRKQRGYVRMPPGSKLVEPKVPGDVQYYLAPLFSAMKQISPRIAYRVREHDFSVNARTDQYTQQAKNWLTGFKSLNKGLKEDLSHDLANKDWDGAAARLTASGNEALARELPKVRVLLDRMHADMTEHGINVGYETDFYPRNVKDYKGLSRTLTGAERTALHKAVSAERQRRGRDLTGDEQARVYSNVIRGGQKADVHPGLAAKGRQLEVVPKSLMPFYGQADEALELAISRTARNVERARLFGPGRVKDLDEAEDFTKAVGLLLDDAVKAGEITAGEQVDVLERMFRSKFVGGEQAAPKWVQAMRNSTYATLLTHPSSAIVNMTDVAYSAFDAGLRNTIKGAFLAAGGKGITVDDLYINNLLQELREKGMGSEIVDKGLQYSGFRTMDRFGKHTLINAQAADIVKKARTTEGMDKLRAEWEPILGNERFINAVAGLSTGQLNDDAKLMLVNKLADYHPVLPSEMPEGFAAHPQGRILYVLHGYQLKQLDVFRQKVLADAKANPIGAAKKMVTLAAFLSMAGVPVGWMQDFVRNRPLRPMSEIVAANLLKMVGLSSYTIDKYHLSPSDPRRTEIGGALADVFMPPFALAQNVIDDLKNAGTQFNTLQNVPVAGRFLYDWFGGGVEKTIKSDYEKHKRRMSQEKYDEDPDTAEIRKEAREAAEKRRMELWQEGF